MKRLQVVKAGGTLLEDPATRQEFLKRFRQIEGPKILVHGGGRSATALAEKLGLKVTLIEGRRVTDSNMLDVALMTYAGRLNKTLVAELQALNCNAVGLSGADGNAVQAVKRPVKEIDYGWVGDITTVNAALFDTFSQAGLVPVCCALTHDGNGQLLNTNADTLAASIAHSLSANYKVELSYCFEKPGVLIDVNDPTTLVEKMDRKRFEEMKTQNQIVAGMIPKLTHCFEALEKGVQSVRVGSMELLNTRCPHTQILK